VSVTWPFESVKRNAPPLSSLTVEPVTENETGTFCTGLPRSSNTVARSVAGRPAEMCGGSALTRRGSAARCPP
jgi:hypothetical protein